VISEHQDLPGLLLELDRQAGLAEEESAAAAESTVTATAATGAVAVALCEARTRIKESEVERLGEILAEMRSGNAAALAVQAAVDRAIALKLEKVTLPGGEIRFNDAAFNITGGNGISIGGDATTTHRSLTTS
jgi:hypothetical protein